MFLICFSDQLIIILYGMRYTDSAYYFKLRTIVCFFQLIAFFPLMLAIDAAKKYAKMHLFAAISIVSFEYLGVLIFNTPQAIAIISIIIRIILVICIMKYIAKIFGIKLIKLFPIRLQLVLIFACVNGVLLLKFILAEFHFNPIVEILTAGCLYLFIILGIFKILKVDIISYIRPLKK